jgi:hypothetical protein
MRRAALTGGGDPVGADGACGRQGGDAARERRLAPRVRAVAGQDGPGGGAPSAPSTRAVRVTAVPGATGPAGASIAVALVARPGSSTRPSPVSRPGAGLRMVDRSNLACSWGVSRRTVS